MVFWFRRVERVYGMRGLGLLFWPSVGFGRFLRLSKGDEEGYEDYRFKENLI